MGSITSAINADKKLKTLEVVISLLTVIGLSLSSWCLKEVYAHAMELEKVRGEIQVVAARQFTAAEGLQVWQAISDLKIAVAKMPGDFPPPSFIKQFDALAGRVGSIENSLSRNSQNLAIQQNILTSILQNQKEMSVKLDRAAKFDTGRLSNQ